MKTITFAMLALTLTAPALAGELRKSGNCTVPVVRRDSGEWKSFPVSLGDSEIHVKCDFMGEECPFRFVAPVTAGAAAVGADQAQIASPRGVTVFFPSFTTPVGWTNVWVWHTPKLTNKLNKVLNVLFFVAFFDKDGNLLVTGNTIIINLDPKQESDAQQMRTVIPQSAFRRIASYKLVVYTTPLDVRPTNSEHSIFKYDPMQGN